MYQTRCIVDTYINVLLKGWVADTVLPLQSITEHLGLKNTINFKGTKI
jgi:hypothetical protein